MGNYPTGLGLNQIETQLRDVQWETEKKGGLRELGLYHACSWPLYPFSRGLKGQAGEGIVKLVMGLEERASVWISMVPC